MNCPVCENKMNVNRIPYTFSIRGNAQTIKLKYYTCDCSYFDYEEGLSDKQKEYIKKKAKPCLCSGIGD